MTRNSRAYLSDRAQRIATIGAHRIADEIVRIPTADGARIACKRKRAAGTPVIFVHGLAVNADLWDVPDIDAADFKFRSLASLLHHAGHDIWLMNLRGCGGPDMLSEPPAGQDDWCIDHFILYDLPAVIDEVVRACDAKPLLIGNSMGAMTIAAYLQGARLIEPPQGKRILADRDTARRRCELVRGAVLIEFPAALRWPQSLYDDEGNVDWRELFHSASGSSASNFPFEIMSRAGWIEALVEATGKVRLDWLRPRREWRERLPEPLVEAFERIDDAIAAAGRFWSKRIKGAQHFRVETFSQGLLGAVDHMKAGVLSQLGKGVRAKAFVSALGERDHVYSDHYDLIESPILLILGGQDRIANAAITREVFYDSIRSTDKRIEVFEDIAHGEFEYAPVACERVYPLICGWIAERDSDAEAV